MEEKTMYKVVKLRYARSMGWRKQPAGAWYVDKSETVIGSKQVASQSVAAAKKNNELAERALKALPDAAPYFYRVEVTEVKVTEVAKGERVIPSVVD